MKRIHICLLLCAVLACGNGKAQSEDELAIPIETDNQFPPDNHSETEGTIIEGSGDGAVEIPTINTTTELNSAPKLEEIEPTATLQNEVIPTTDSAGSCPKPCVCSIEGSEFVVDCSGYGLTEFPSPIDTKTTKLNLQKNKLTEIPKEVSLLKNLKELNANDNLIMELASGSVSELPSLEVLKLANNRLIDYPKDLKNSLSLTNLQDLDLGGNDMRTTLSAENFMGFSSLHKITLPTSTPDLVHDLCIQLKATLELVCTESCEKESFDCPDAPQELDKDFLDATLPGMLSFVNTVDEENADPTIHILTNLNIDKQGSSNKESKLSGSVETTVATSTDEKATPLNEISLRTIIHNAPVAVAPAEIISNSPKKENNHTDGEVKIGAKTIDTKSGGVDRSLIAIIVAGMVVIVAGVTIKKNWSSIKKRFSSTPRPPSERPAGNANGTSPEEVPLQDKSPV